MVGFILCIILYIILYFCRIILILSFLKSIKAFILFKRPEKYKRGQKRIKYRIKGAKKVYKKRIKEAFFRIIRPIFVLYSIIRIKGFYTTFFGEV